MPIQEQPRRGLPTTPYQQQLERGFRLLRFRSPLEQEFRLHLAPSARLTQRLGGLLVMLVGACYLLLEHSLLNVAAYPWRFELALLRGLEVAVGGVVLLISFHPRHGQAFTNALLGTLLVLVGMVAAQIDLLYEASGLVSAVRYGVGIFVVCAFFFLGLTFWWAAFCAGLMMLLDILMALRVLPQPQMAAHWVAGAYYLLLFWVGAIGRYAHEYGQREQFLVRRLLSWMADHDGLTGLCNRRSFDAALQRVSAQARRVDVPLTLMLVDLDEFKGYNDSLGHPAGDRLLVDFARLFGQFARRPLDMAARVGGEEFALLLYDCDEGAAGALGEELLQSLRLQAYPHPASQRAGHVTASIGIALLEPEQPPERFYKRADDALYTAKQAGRDRYVLARPAA